MFECQICNFSTSRPHDLKRHNESKRHVRIAYKISKQNIGEDDEEFKNAVLNDSDSCANSITKNINDSFDDAKSQTDMSDEHEKKPTKKIHRCECGKIFGNSGNLCRHRKICDRIPKEVKVNYEEKINKLEIELAEIKKQLLQSNVTKTVTNSNNQSNNTTNTTNSNNQSHVANTKIYSDNTVNNNKISVFAYLDTHHTDTPAIKMLETDDITRILANCEIGKHLLEDVIVFQQSKHVLHMFLGDFILKEFKKNDPTKQHFWLVDLSRLKFAVRLALSKTNVVWQPDPKGICLTKYIITPILDEIFSMMTDYKELCDERMKNSETSDQCDKIHKQSTNSLEIIYDINQKNLHRKILTYVAPYFQLELKNQETKTIKIKNNC